MSNVRTVRESDPTDKSIVSVIITVFDVESYVGQCLQSVADQTYPNCQILVVDDGSTDASGNICDSFALKYENFGVIHTTNGGLSVARNIGIEGSIGDYIQFLDADDWIEPYAIESLLRTAQETESDIVVCHHSTEWLRKTEMPKRCTVSISLDGDDVMRWHVRDTTVGSYAWGKLFFQELFDGLRFPEGVVYEDVFVAWRVFGEAKRITCIPEILYHYRMRRSSIIHALSFRSVKDRWIVYVDRYKSLSLRSAECNAYALADCMRVVCWAWRVYYDVPKEERCNLRELCGEMAQFAKAHYIDTLFGPLEMSIKLALFFCLWPCGVSFAVMYLVDQLGRQLSGRGVSEMYA